MTTKDGASAPDVLTRTMPALSSTSDMPDVAATTTVEAPPTSATSGPKVGDKTPEPAKSEPSKENLAPADDGKTLDPVIADAGDKGDKAKPGINERFSKLTADRKAAEEKARAEEATRVAAEQRADKLATELEQALAAIKQTLPPAPEDIRPERAKFDEPNAYDAALTEWAGRIATKKARADAEASFTQQREREATEAKTAQLKAENERVAAEYSARMLKFKEEKPDYDEVIMNEKLQVTETMGGAIFHMPEGPKIAYYLGQNLDEAARIAALSPPMQLMALGELRAKVNAPPKTTSTPDPIVPLNTGRNAATGKTADEMSMDEYAAKRAAEMRPPAKGARS